MHVACKQNRGDLPMDWPPCVVYGEIRIGIGPQSRFCAREGSLSDSEAKYNACVDVKVGWLKPALLCGTKYNAHLSLYIFRQLMYY
jgi:hypothetical protein